MRNRKRNKKINKKLLVIISVCIAALISVLILFLFIIPSNKVHTPKKADEPTLTIETPKKLNISEDKDIIIDVTLSSLGEALYPAASMSISFDPSRLEFQGIEEGNVFVKNGGGDVSQQLPEWSCNTEQSNKSGKINIMYLDITGGQNAFSRELLSKKNNVVLRLKFRARGSLREGDVCDLIFEDACFAASDESQSLAMTVNTLKVKNGKIVIGE